MRVTVKVVPNARCSEISRCDGDCYRVRIKAPAVDFKANKALIEFLAKICGVKKNAVRIVSGESSRLKLVEIPDGTWPGEAENR